MPDLPLFKSRYSVPLHFLFELFTGREKKPLKSRSIVMSSLLCVEQKHCSFKPSCIPPRLVANGLGVAVSTAQAAHV